MKALSLDMYCITIGFTAGPDHFFTLLDSKHVEKIKLAQQQLQASKANSMSFVFSGGVFVDTLFVETVMERHGVDLLDLDATFFKSSVAMDNVELVVTPVGIYFQASPLHHTKQFLCRTDLVRNERLFEPSKLNFLSV